MALFSCYQNMFKLQALYTCNNFHEIFMTLPANNQQGSLESHHWFFRGHCLGTNVLSFESFFLLVLI